MKSYSILTGVAAVLAGHNQRLPSAQFWVSRIWRARMSAKYAISPGLGFADMRSKHWSIIPSAFAVWPCIR